jgi:hypothetical protein
VLVAEADEGQEPVRHAVVAGEEDREHQGRGDHRREVRQQDADPPERLPAQLAVEQVRDDQREQQLRHGRQQEDAERVVERVPEVGVGEQLREVGESGPAVLVRLVQPPGAQRHDRVVHDREQAEDREQDEERRDEDVRDRLGVEAVEPELGPVRLGRRRRVLRRRPELGEGHGHS